MIRTVATGILALTAMFAVDATAADFKDGVTAVTIQHKSAPDREIHMLVKRAKDKNGDGIFSIQKTKNSKQWLGVKNNKVDWGAKATEWILHKNSTGWSIMLRSNGALAVSVVNGEAVLQRNQGAAHQVWQIEKK